MGYWVINKHLESHLLISEGHPWGICDPLSRLKTLHIKCLHHPQCLSTPALNFCLLLSQVLSSPGFDSGILGIDFDLGIFLGLILLSYTPHKSFFSCSLGKKAAQCNQQWGKLAGLAENRTNIVPWFVQFWGVFLGFGRETRLQRGRIMAKSTPVNKLQLLSGVDDKRKFWVSRSSKRRLWTGGF